MLGLPRPRLLDSVCAGAKADQIPCPSNRWRQALRESGRLRVIRKGEDPILAPDTADAVRGDRDRLLPFPPPSPLHHAHSSHACRTVQAPLSPGRRSAIDGSALHSWTMRYSPFGSPIRGPAGYACESSVTQPSTGLQRVMLTARSSHEGVTLSWPGPFFANRHRWRESRHFFISGGCSSIALIVNKTRSFPSHVPEATLSNFRLNWTSPGAERAFGLS